MAECICAIILMLYQLWSGNPYFYWCLVSKCRFEGSKKWPFDGFIKTNQWLPTLFKIQLNRIACPLIIHAWHQLSTDVLSIYKSSISYHSCVFSTYNYWYLPTYIILYGDKVWFINSLYSTVTIILTNMSMIWRLMKYVIRYPNLL